MIDSLCFLPGVSNRSHLQGRMTMPQKLLIIRMTGTVQRAKERKNQRDRIRAGISGLRETGLVYVRVEPLILNSHLGLADLKTIVSLSTI